ncbi:hypothetical protein OG555_02975 [Kribbella sp. NBC_01484]|uniref:hypothetical protein n=1 Tax=Kribbella sp. NBC_01484 TaxID=2903579 RepID=UPI002E352D25|nr:hypothetical protein [Kribbella sp. NBC_01484]
MTDGPNEPAYEDNRIDLSETRKSADLFNVEPAQPDDGQFMSMMSVYEPAPEPSTPSAPSAASTEE